MSRYPIAPIEFAALRTVPLAARGGKVRVADFATPYQAGAGVAGLLRSMPRILAGESLRAVVAAILAARAAGKPVIWGLGGHVIKCGLAPVLIDLMRRGYATAFAMNGAAAIHDFEIALAGHTSEDVEAVLPDGSFGAAEETGREMNRAIAAARPRFASAWARRWAAGWTRSPTPRFAAQQPAACRPGARGVPVTVHVAIGTDTPHTHPAADPARHRRGHAPRFPPVLRAGARTWTRAASTSTSARRWCCRRCF